MAMHDHVVPLILEGRIAELADALIDLPGYALTNLPAGAIGPAVDWLASAGRLEEALVLYHSAHAVQAAIPLPVTAAEALVARGQTEMALDLLKGWMDGARKRPGEYVAQANALEELAGPKSALPVIAAAARAYPQSGPFATHHARLLLETGDIPGALAELDRGLDADPIQAPWVRALRAALAGEPVTLGPLALDLPIATLGARRLMAILRGTHRAPALAATLDGLAPGAHVHDAAAGAGLLALQITRAAPEGTVTAAEPDAELAELAGRNLAANGLPGAMTMPEAPTVLIAPLGADLPDIPASVTRLIAEPDPDLTPERLTAHLSALFARGFALDLAHAPVLTLTRSA